MDCVVTGCDGEVHARGLCRAHYGQIWRHGKITSVIVKRRDASEHEPVESDLDRIASLRRKLGEAKKIYEIAIGFRLRMEWKKRILDLEHGLEELTK